MSSWDSSAPVVAFLIVGFRCVDADHFFGAKRLELDGIRTCRSRTVDHLECALDRTIVIHARFCDDVHAFR